MNGRDAFFKKPAPEKKLPLPRPALRPLDLCGVLIRVRWRRRMIAVKKTENATEIGKAPGSYDEGVRVERAVARSA